MDNQINKLAKMLKLWFTKSGLDGDLTIYYIDEWRNRKEPYHNDSEMVIVTEGQLNFIINYSSDSEIYEEFEELLESFGYFYELGHSWNLGIYKIDETARQNISTSYFQKLSDERWIKKRDLVRNRAEFKCEDCSTTQGHLEIHHCYYLYGYEPWEYPTSSLRCLCKSCHITRDPIEKKNRGLLAHLTQEEIQTINDFLETATYWYPKQKVFEFLKSMNYDKEGMRSSLDDLIANHKNSQNDTTD